MKPAFKSIYGIKLRVFEKIVQKNAKKYKKKH